MLYEVITIIDVYSALQSHTDEYTYFRTDETWTAVGSYYAAEAFLESKSIKIYPIDDYFEDKFINYLGAYRSVEGAESISDYPDTIFFYLMKNSVNDQNITSYHEGAYYEFQSPTLALSRRATDIFVGPYYSHSIIEGDLDNGSSIMILGDKYSKIFTPWLIPYYDKICLVDPAYYNRNNFV